MLKSDFSVSDNVYTSLTKKDDSFNSEDNNNNNNNNDYITNNKNISR